MASKNKIVGRQASLSQGVNILDKSRPESFRPKFARRKSVCGAHFVQSEQALRPGKLILIRHGRTSLNLAGEHERLRGWLDVPLDDHGLSEAKETAARVVRHGIATIYSSDLARAIQTSATISRVTGARVVPAGDLRPWNLGSFSGQLIREIVPFLDFLKDRPDLPAPGGESWNQFYDRYSKRLLALMALAADSCQVIAAVTHVRNFLAAPTVIHGGDRHNVEVRGGPKTGSVYVIEQTNGQWSVRADQ